MVHNISIFTFDVILAFTYIDDNLANCEQILQV